MMFVGEFRWENPQIGNFEIDIDIRRMYNIFWSNSAHVEVLTECTGPMLGSCNGETL